MELDIGFIIYSVLVISIIIIIVSYVKCPFKFPYKEIKFDITSKRNPDELDYIDQYLIDNEEIGLIMAINKLEQWKKECKIKISKSVFKRHRYKQYKECLDENNMFKFIFYRVKTRYRQVDYVKYPYYVKEICKIYSTSYSFLHERYMQLKDIGFECTLREYYSSSQRKLMTKELRAQVAIRDNYTCQKCGKYMPDGVGLHIDHIVPISKGGKSIPSNLQVLCSKCNGSKSNK